MNPPRLPEEEYFMPVEAPKGNTWGGLPSVSLARSFWEASELLGFDGQSSQHCVNLTVTW